MRFPRKSGRLVAAATALLLAPLVALTGTASADTGDTDGITVAHTELSRWPSGYSAEITISNASGAPLNDWTIEFDLPKGAEVHEMWNASLTEEDGGYTVTPPRWGTSVPDGGEYTFGYNGAFSDGETAPVECTVNGAPCDGSGADPAPYRQVGYFTQWGPADRGFSVKDLAESGSAAKLTHLNYAFAGLTEDGRCTLSDKEGIGDPYADYGRPYTAEESVDGKADQPDQDLKGNFNELRELKQMYPDLKVYISIGGWALSDYFSNAALAKNREESVESCVDMFLRGNLPEMDGVGGKGSAAGLFDGIDLDWEWPATPGEPGNVVRPEDKENYTAFVDEFRTQMDGLERETGQEYGLTAFVPASTAAIEAGFEVSELMEDFSFINVQGYDFTGTWSMTTGHQSNLGLSDRPGASERSLKTVVQEYVDRGAERSDIVVGMPFYGRGWTGVEPGEQGDGLHQSATGAAPGTYEAGYNAYRILKKFKDEGFTVYRDEAAGAAWLYNGTEFWTFDDPAVLAKKAAWVREAGLGGAMAWSLDGDDAQGHLYDAIDSELNGR